MLQEFFGQYADIINGVSISTVALVGLSVLKFFKKDKYVIPFFNKAKAKAEDIFGVANVSSFVKEAKELKVSEIKPAIKDYANRFLRVEQMLETILENQLELGAFDNNEDRKEKVNSLL